MDTPDESTGTKTEPTTQLVMDTPGESTARKSERQKRIERKIKTDQKAAEEKEKKANELRIKQEQMYAKAMQDAQAFLQQKRDDDIRTFLKAYGVDMQECAIHIHHVSRSKSAEYVTQLKELEITTQAPLQSDHPDFPRDKTCWIYEPGVHLVWDDDNLDIVAAMRITAWSAMPVEERQQVQHAISVMMHYTEVTPPIANNGSQKLKTNETEKMAGKRKVQVKTPDIKLGKMFAAGWHGTRGEPDIDLSYYTVKRYGSKQRRLDNTDKYRDMTSQLIYVRTLYARKLCTLFPRGFFKVITESERNTIPSFCQLELPSTGISDALHFANSLTITRNDFANYQHTDNDEIDVAYGWWWTAKKTKDDWTCDDSIDHHQVQGGEFVIAQYAIGVDFQRCQGLVEIYWRGETDYHGTLQSSGPKDITRFGTSVQITQGGVRGVKRFVQNGEQESRSIGAVERVERAYTAAQDVQ